MMDFLFGIGSPIAYLIVFIFLILCGLGNPIPEDTILIAAGYLSYSGVVDIYLVGLISYVGILCGDFLLYFFGWKYGQKIINHPRLIKLIPIKRVDRVRKRFQKWGHWTVFFARFLVGLRSPTFILSGLMRVPFKRFVLLDCLGGLVSVPLFIGLGYIFGAQVDVLRKNMHAIRGWLIVGIVILIFIGSFWLWFKIKREDEEEL